MMKTLKAGLFGLAMGVLGAVAFPTQQAEAQSCLPINCTPGCCSSCNPRYQACLSSAGNNSAAIAQCVSSRSYCESVCSRTC